MLFKDYHINLIRNGEKTVTRREWDENYHGPSVGSVVIASTHLFTSDEEADCYIRITDKREERLGEITEESARREGDYDGVNDFRDGYERVYGDGAWDDEKVVTVVEFQYVGRSREGTEQTKLITDGGQRTDGTDRRDPADDPAACSKCGVHIGAFGDEYCESCARELGVKPPMVSCTACGRTGPQEQMESIDVSPPDEYYPDIEYLCRDCTNDSEGQE